MDYNSRNRSAGPLGVVSSFLEAYKSCKIQNSVYRNYSGPSFLENFNSQLFVVFSILLFSANFYPISILRKKLQKKWSVADPQGTNVWNFWSKYSPFVRYSWLFWLQLHSKKPIIFTFRVLFKTFFCKNKRRKKLTIADPKQITFKDLQNNISTCLVLFTFLNAISFQKQ